MSVVRRCFQLGREAAGASLSPLVALLAKGRRPRKPPAVLRAETADARRRAVRAPLAEQLTVTGSALSDVAERLEALNDGVARLGREQFQATTLLEGQGAALEELFEAWRGHLDRHAREAGELQQAQAERDARVRLELVQSLLPVVDALDASTRAARQLFEELQVAPSPTPSWLARLRGTVTEPPTAAAARGAAVESWLQGLLLIEQRLLAILEREGVRPIPALGQPFDPHRHLAVAVQDDGRAPDGTVVEEELRGYALGDRVLRHAEVVVARRGSSGGGSQQASEQ
jgi:molecular chaperone GrpE (heat shock protein)